jgi:hypothetical protein
MALYLLEREREREREKSLSILFLSMQHFEIERKGLSVVLSSNWSQDFIMDPPPHGPKPYFTI